MVGQRPRVLAAVQVRDRLRHLLLPHAVGHSRCRLGQGRSPASGPVSDLASPRARDADSGAHCCSQLLQELRILLGTREHRRRDGVPQIPMWCPAVRRPGARHRRFGLVPGRSSNLCGDAIFPAVGSLTGLAVQCCSTSALRARFAMSEARHKLCLMPYVCPECFPDAWLKRVVREHATADKCDLCRVSGPRIAAPIESVVEHIKAWMSGSFTESIPVPWREGEPATWHPGTTWSTDELLWDLLGLDVRDRPKLLSALVDALGRERRWALADPAVFPEHERLRLNWARISWRIKHDSRFFLLSAAPERIALEELGRRCLTFGLIRTLPAGTRL